MESEEVSGLIIECVSQIKSVIAAKTSSTSSTTSELTTGARDPEELSTRESSTVCINSSSGDKTGAPVVYARSRSPPVTVDKLLERHELSFH